MDLKKRHIELCKTERGYEFETRQVIRINTLKAKEEDVIKRLKSKDVNLVKVNGLNHAYYADSEFSLSSMSEYLFGYFYIQEIASQYVPLVLNPKPQDLVLDMCASPGSKTTQMAQMMGNKGTIFALDVGIRINKLKYNVERMGIENTIVIKSDARFFEAKLKGNSNNANENKLLFDKILLDAPCSGNYVIEKDWFKKRTIEDVKGCSLDQRELIRNAIKNLKDDGILVYSTCSLEPEENEFVIDWAINKYVLKCLDTGLKIGENGLTQVSGKVLDSSISKCKRFWPSQTGTQGFFVGKFGKN